MRTSIALLFCFLSLCLSGEEAGTLKLTKTIRLPGVKGRFDHFAVDTKDKRLFVAALGNNTLEVIDVAAGKHLESIRGLDKPQGVLYLAESNLIAVANGNDGALKFFNGQSYELVKGIGSLNDAENVRVDARTKLAYTGY